MDGVSRYRRHAGDVLTIEYTGRVTDLEMSRVAMMRYFVRKICNHVTLRSEPKRVDAVLSTM